MELSELQYFIEELENEFLEKKSLIELLSVQYRIMHSYHTYQCLVHGTY
jgi:hypothetical protein